MAVRLYRIEARHKTQTDHIMICHRWEGAVKSTVKLLESSGYHKVQVRRVNRTKRNRMEAAQADVDRTFQNPQTFTQVETR